MYLALWTKRTAINKLGELLPPLVGVVGVFEGWLLRYRLILGAIISRCMSTFFVKIATRKPFARICLSESFLLAKCAFYALLNKTNENFAAVI